MEILHFLNDNVGMSYTHFSLSGGVSSFTNHQVIYKGTINTGSDVSSTISLRFTGTALTWMNENLRLTVI